MGKRIFKNLMCIYLIFLIFFVVLKFDGSFDELISIHQRIIENETMGIKNSNLVLFRTITPYVSNITEPYALKNYREYYSIYSIRIFDFSITC